MSSSARYLVFDGQFESKVLGTFRILRGFANLQDLAEISVPYEMESDGTGVTVTGQQRKLDTQHAERIKRFLESGAQRFLPEVILSIRSEFQDELDLTQTPIGVRSASEGDGIAIWRRWKSQNMRIHRLRIDRSKLEAIRVKRLIRRVDGNHRLALASSLKEDESLPTKYLASFCMLLLGTAGELADDYSESLIFHTINSTALPLESEHALTLILGQHSDYDMTPVKELAFSPELHFARLLRDGLLKLPDPVRTRIGNRPLTSLRAAARGLLDMDPTVANDLPTLENHSDALLAALTDIVTRLEPDQPALCKAEFFVELAARVWKSTPSGDDHNSRVNAAVTYLEQLAGWLGMDGLVDLREDQSLSKQILDIFTAVRARIPRRVFLARWYPEASDGDELEKAKLRLRHIRLTLREVEEETGVHLELVDLGTASGTAFPIHAKMYDAIASADIILVDLSGVRPNVCVEAGYALRHHEKNRLIFIFQPSSDHPRVPFDLNTFRYELLIDSGAMSDALKPNILAILHNAEIGA